MHDQSPQSFQRLKDALLSGPGETSAALRQLLARQPDHLLRTPGESLDEALPAELKDYTTKVVTHAYKVMDQDVERLRAHGYTEQAIFEITVSVAFGAGDLCLTRGLAALEGATHAPEER
ncbi:hypothetical protein KDA_44560 [Dictyobacter alpinus]|uniref:Carboxymuconolactone decarboxylase-like domain-containing protein n=1 Tax=Dictyobacter alpinus TaxID=2014873 RepID=A0A402BCG0_9CHLR|nr:hypothetical protein [Dictyobacter alpinus]GCE28972.1 hypothetical protein KDA_44560 [Dictyobacter alpinus]